MTQELLDTLPALRVGRPLVVAIDGPSGSGKSSVSKEVARRLRLAYLDTGAMYRALTWFCVTSGIDLGDAAAVEQAARDLVLELSTTPQEDYVRVDGADVTEAIREPAISSAVSAVATTLGARTELIRRQRELIEKHHRRMVVEGRDITTVVAPGAEVRMLLTASEEATAPPPRHPAGRHPERGAARRPGHPPRCQGFHGGELHPGRRWRGDPGFLGPGLRGNRGRRPGDRHEGPQP